MLEMTGLPVQGTAIGKLFVLCLVFAYIIGCSDFYFYSLLDGDAKGGDTGEPLEIVPISVNLAVGDEFTFSASGGTPPYSFVVVSGTGTVDSTTGTYIAPSEAAREIIRVVDDAGNESEAQIVVIE